MPIFFLSSRIPELREYSPEERAELLELAMESIPISLGGLLSVAAVMVPIVIPLVALAAAGHTWASWLFLFAGPIVLHFWWINYSSKRIREIIQERKNTCQFKE